MINFSQIKRLAYLPVLISTISVSNCLAQNVGVNTTGVVAAPSAIFDLNTGSNFASPNGKGFLMPQVSLTSNVDVTTINAPATNLQVFNINAAMTNGSGVGVYFFDGVKWIYMVSVAAAGTLGQVLTSQGGGTAPIWTTLPAGGIGVANFVTDAAGIVYTNGDPRPRNSDNVLDLSSVTGTGVHLAMLKVQKVSGTSSATIRFKESSETKPFSTSATAGGASAISLTNASNNIGYIMAKTDATGKLKFQTSSSIAHTINIYVIGYW